MNEPTESQSELLSRFELVEMMVKEGRQSTEYWGWSLVLWGTAYLIAIAWSNWLGMPQLAWGVTMTVALILTWIVVYAKKKKHLLQTTVSRSIGAIWTAIGFALLIFCFGISISGHWEPHSGTAAIEAFLGAVNCASSMILRWRGQFFVALLWWAAAIATCFAPVAAIGPIFIVATLIGMIGFGLYLMISERRDRSAAVQHG